MARQRRAQKMKIVSERGEIFVVGCGMDVHFKYKPWLIKLNPALVPKGMRKEHRKTIYANGEKFGTAEMRYGGTPLPQYQSRAGGFAGWFFDFLRINFGWGKRKSERGYMLVTLQRHKFVILKSITEEGNLFCQAFFYHSGNRVATFTFDKNFDRVYPNINRDNWLESIMIMAGYVADVMIYSTVAASLNKSIEIMY